MSELEVTPAQIRYAAINLLAMREHSLGELRQKLARKLFPADVIDTVLQGLVDDQLQSDERFAQAFINMRRRQGKGPVRIRQELREKALAPELIASLVDDSEQDWLDLAYQAKVKRFGTHSPEGPKERAKQMRFLLYRGFTSGQIHKVLI